MKMIQINRIKINKKCYYKEDYSGLLYFIFIEKKFGGDTYKKFGGDTTDTIMCENSQEKT